ncbi:hypothetical protein [Spongiimicrobium salis]|uniref:hypothetical protein n=1 Tax=Spongiimicrobium salis TaxID=1667022 RepID=UPI00374CD63A
MYHYFKYNTANEVECFLELDREFYCERALYKTKKEIINTYITIEDESYFLPEGSLKEAVTNMTLSSKTEFNQLWKVSMLAFEDDWSRLKNKFKIGDMVKTKILCFYPKGIISNFGEEFHALSDYHICEKKFGQHRMYPKNELELEVSGFDDINKLILLGPFNRIEPKHYP